MAKNVLIALLLGATLYLGYMQYQSRLPVPQDVPTPVSEAKPDTVVCAQVITPAINPDTKEIKEFPTPCDVPKGWDVIQNDVPALDLEVQ